VTLHLKCRHALRLDDLSRWSERGSNFLTLAQRTSLTLKAARAGESDDYQELSAACRHSSPQAVKGVGIPWRHSDQDYVFFAG
jgi:hypothetical protein